mmetsp:Transcript_8216/g.21218  ORF Transcript_8216/g.21218 Transcript_8216/m.21218 type:complete len:200 (-) Transcript_8216:295-894(-)
MPRNTSGARRMIAAARRSSAARRSCVCSLRCCWGNATTWYRRRPASLTSPRAASSSYACVAKMLPPCFARPRAVAPPSAPPVRIRTTPTRRSLPLWPTTTTTRCARRTTRCPRRTTWCPRSPRNGSFAAFPAAAFLAKSTPASLRSEIRAWGCTRGAPAGLSCPLGSEWALGLPLRAAVTPYFWLEVPSVPVLFAISRE